MEELQRQRVLVRALAVRREPRRVRAQVELLVLVLVVVRARLARVVLVAPVVVRREPRRVMPRRRRTVLIKVARQVLMARRAVMGVRVRAVRLGVTAWTVIWAASVLLVVMFKMSAEAVKVRTYGNWRIPRRAGFGKMGFGESIFGLVGLAVVSVVAMSKGVVIALAVAVVWAGLVLLMVTRDVHGVSVAERMNQRMRFGRAARRKSNIHATGGIAPDATQGMCELPGMLHASRLSEHRDSYERPFGLIEHGDGTLSVVMSVAPEGGAVGNVAGGPGRADGGCSGKRVC